ncbi:hypothetical protein BD413DRAFT_36346 [Trametes elegans]|nr:hypothetical protein BD413DRAFT_36346 [Trametes elegans]
MTSRAPLVLRCLNAVSRPAVRTSRCYSTSRSAVSCSVRRAPPSSLHLSNRCLLALLTAPALEHKNAAVTRAYSSRTNESSESPVGTAVQSFPDPDRPDLFYHLYPAPTSISSTTPVFALSFTPDPPPSVLSAAVVGWLPASGASEGEAGLNDFVENERFREVLHEAVQSALRDGVDEVQKNGAIQTREGWMHIHGTPARAPRSASVRVCASRPAWIDNRNIPALGRIGDPDDIIASVRVENGEVLSETYQPMPSYRLCTSDGVVQLTEGLAQRLLEVVKARVGEERQS